jgi:hypothetical protein
MKMKRSTLAKWAGALAAELAPLTDHLLGFMKALG